MTGSSITLNNGLDMPQVGLGTWDPSPGPMKEAVKHAIKCGYRHIDCAYVYQNEAAVGDAIKELVDAHEIERKDLFLVSKLWCTFHSKEKVLAGFEATLKALKTDHIDLYLIHAPYGFAEDTAELFPCDENKSMIFSDIDFLETWQEMEKLVDKGLVKSLGISNFNAAQTARLLDACRIKPVTNQVECHPYLNNEKLRQFSAEKGIVLTAYAPLGSPGKPWESGVPNLMSDPVVASVAEKHSKTPVQVLIRFAVERGIIVVPKSTNPERIAQNFQIFDFSLDLDDTNKLMSLNGKDGAGRMFAFENCKDHPLYPFHDEY